MSQPEPVLSEDELKGYNGETRTRKYIAFNGVVYDVTDCPKWWAEMHEGLHFPGIDLSQAIGEAPHGEEVLSRPCVKRIGILAGKKKK